MIVSMLQIYLRKERDRLLTTGLFSMTRHPMYHGMFLASLASFFHANLNDPIFWLLWISYVILAKIVLDEISITKPD
jgi:protein-S-isoprenylcysteine O-methyltransferase Ste14